MSKCLSNWHLGASVGHSREGFFGQFLCWGCCELNKPKKSRQAGLTPDAVSARKPHLLFHVYTRKEKSAKDWSSWPPFRAALEIFIQLATAFIVPLTSPRFGQKFPFEEPPSLLSEMDRWANRSCFEHAREKRMAWGAKKEATHAAHQFFVSVVFLVVFCLHQCSFLSNGMVNSQGSKIGSWKAPQLFHGRGKPESNPSTWTTEIFARHPKTRKPRLQPLASKKRKPLAHGVRVCGRVSLTVTFNLPYSPLA